MKRMLLILLIGILSLAGCQSAQDPNSADQNRSDPQTPTAEEQKPILGNYGVYDMTGEFIEQVHSNPIDRDYQDELDKLHNSPDFTTQDWVELEDKYAKIWDHELNVIYQKLLTKLNETEKATLIQAQKGWLQFHLAESDFVAQTFYGRPDGAIFGSQGRVQMVSALSQRLRDRTLQLMEYYSLLDGEVEFAYTGAN